MSLSTKKRARRIREQWAKWWRSRPVVYPQYGVSFVDPRTGKMRRVIGTFTDYGELLCYMTKKLSKAPPHSTPFDVMADYEPTPRPAPAKYQIGEYVVGVDMAASTPAIPRRGVVPFYESMMKAIGRQVLPEGYEVAFDPGASGRPLAIVDMKGLGRALDRSVRVTP